MKSPRTIIHQMAMDAWSAGTTTLALCGLLELIERGFVSRFFNLLWLLLFVLTASLAVMATRGRLPGDEVRESSKTTGIFLRLVTLAVAAAVWFLLPQGLRLFWRAAATGGILLAVLATWPVFSQHD